MTALDKRVIVRCSICHKEIAATLGEDAGRLVLRQHIKATHRENPAPRAAASGKDWW